MLKYKQGTLFEFFTGRCDHLQDLIARFLRVVQPTSYELVATVALPGDVVMVVFAYEVTKT